MAGGGSGGVLFGNGGVGVGEEGGRRKEGKEESDACRRCLGGAGAILLLSLSSE